MQPVHELDVFQALVFPVCSTEGSSPEEWASPWQCAVRGPRAYVMTLVPVAMAWDSRVCDSDLGIDDGFCHFSE